MLGVVLFGFVVGEMVMMDMVVYEWFEIYMYGLDYVISLSGVVFVVVVGLLLLCCGKVEVI